MMTEQLWIWIGFNLFVLAMLALDLGVFHRKRHVVSFREAIASTVAWNRHASNNSLRRKGTL